MKQAQSDDQAVEVLEYMASQVNGALALKIGRDLERWSLMRPDEKLAVFRRHRLMCQQAAPHLRTKDRINHAEEALRLSFSGK